MLQTLANWLYFAMSGLLHLTYRYRFYDVGHRRLAERGHPKRVCVVAMPSEDRFTGVLGHAFQRCAPLCKRSVEGKLEAFLYRRMGLVPVAEPISPRDGAPTASMLAKAAAYGFSPLVGIESASGSDGIAKDVLQIAATSGVKVLPMVATIDRFWTLKGRAGLKLPKPFARVVIGYGVPFPVPESPTTEEFAYFSGLLATRLANLQAKGQERLQSADTSDSLTYASVRRGLYEVG